MEFIEWTEKMSVSSEVLDGHHKMLIGCLNRLYPLIGATGSTDEINEVLGTLEEFVLLHFSEEEQAMKKAGYPDWRAHKEQHDRMYDIVFKLKTDIEHGHVPDAERLFALLYDWLMAHILGEDRKYIPYMANPEPTPTAVWTRSSGKRY